MRIIRNYDVASYYPHLMTVCSYTSRNIPNPAIFSDVLETRMKAKAAGDKATANALKLVVNTTYGAMLNQYNDLYDPLMGRSVCISGQLYLLELAEHLYQTIPDLRIVQLNTDGIMIEFDDSYYEQVKEIVDEWQERTGFELEEDKIVKIVQKDVNGYIEVQANGSVKTKGGYLVRGLAGAGAFKVNNDACIVATAIKEFFVNGTPVEETIGNCDDIRQFQIIAKAGAKYKESYYMVDGEPVPVQKVNRVYATADERYGKLYKVKMEDDSNAKIASLPEHCIVDNDNHLSISDVDKSFYIDMARKRVNDFLGIKPERKSRRSSMATAKSTATVAPKNVYQKLIEARQAFLDSYVQQSGKNMSLEFMYFELKDIVPTVTKIFKETGLIAIDNFSADTATLTIVNTDSPEETILFAVPFDRIQPIVSNTGKQVTNVMQALGSSITYMRRYLYLIAMDICVNDEIEPSIDKTTNKPEKQTEHKAPATPQQREEIKKELTSPADLADELQIKGLKKVLAKYRAAFPEEGNALAMELAERTKAFTEISKTECEKIINKLSDKLKEAQ